MLERVCAWVQFDLNSMLFFLTFDLSSLLLFLFSFFFFELLLCLVTLNSMYGCFLNFDLNSFSFSSLFLFFLFFFFFFFFFLFSFFILQFNLNSVACDYTDHLSSSRGLLLCAAKGPCSVSCHSELVSDCTHLCLLHKTGYQYEYE